MLVYDFMIMLQFLYLWLHFACLLMHAAIYTYIIIHSFSMQPSYRYGYILVVATYNITYIATLLKINLPFIKCRSTSVSISVGPECMVYSVPALLLAESIVIHLRTCCVSYLQNVFSFADYN